MSGKINGIRYTDTDIKNLDVVYEALCKLKVNECDSVYRVIQILKSELIK